MTWPLKPWLARCECRRRSSNLIVADDRIAGGRDPGRGVVVDTLPSTTPPPAMIPTLFV